MSVRMGGWLGALALTIAWLFASVGEPPAAHDRTPQAPEAPTPTRTASQFSERLQRSLSAAPAAPRPHRNPFEYGAGRGRPSAPAESEAPPPAPPPNVAPPAPPPMTLAGIGTSETPDGPVRTAVLSATGRVLLVQAGDELPSGLRVVRVEEDHVVLVDASGAEMKLYLK
jgi:hypothetical protein